MLTNIFSEKCLLECSGVGVGLVIGGGVYRGSFAVGGSFRDGVDRGNRGLSAGDRVGGGLFVLSAEVEGNDRGHDHQYIIRRDSSFQGQHRKDGDHHQSDDGFYLNQVRKVLNKLFHYVFLLLICRCRFMVGLQIFDVVLTLCHLPLQFEGAFNDIIVLVDLDTKSLQLCVSYCLVNL